MDRTIDRWRDGEVDGEVVRKNKQSNDRLTDPHKKRDRMIDR